MITGALRLYKLHLYERILLIKIPTISAQFNLATIQPGPSLLTKDKSPKRHFAPCTPCKKVKGANEAFTPPLPATLLDFDENFQ